MSTPSTQTVYLGSAYRLYKNSLGKVLALDTLKIYTDVIPKSPFDYNQPLIYTEWVHKSYMGQDRLFVHLGEGDRVISSIQVFGDYIEIENVSGDYLWAKWAKAGGDSENPTISFADLPGVGDSI